MKVYAESDRDDFALNRIANAIKKYAPEGIEFVKDELDADLVIIYAWGLRRKVWWRVDRILKRGRRYAIVQTAVRATRNPDTRDWFNIWKDAKVVWSYLDLDKMIEADDHIEFGGLNHFKFNFYFAPLGVDTEVFKEYLPMLWRKYIIASGNGRDESVNEIKECVDKDKILRLGQGTDDASLAIKYSMCIYVSGLRRKEGFEMPVIEGLMCGARPICFDKPHYRDWFGDLVEYIPEGTHDEVVKSLTELFKKESRPVTDKEKQYVKERFNWETIVKGFWERLV